MIYSIEFYANYLKYKYLFFLNFDLRTDPESDPVFFSLS